MTKTPEPSCLCCKNKVLDWRQGSEKDIYEAIQTYEGFLNVGKGQVLKVFGTSDRLTICRFILAKVHLQVSESCVCEALQRSFYHFQLLA